MDKIKSVPLLNVSDGILARLITSEVATYSDDAIRRNATALMLRMELQSPEAFAEMKAQAEVVAAEVEAEVMGKRRQRETKKN